jgi:hypothetical protein
VGPLTKQDCPEVAGEAHLGLEAAALPKPSAVRSDPKRAASGVDCSAGLEAPADSQLAAAGTAAILSSSFAESSSPRPTFVVAAVQQVPA